MTTRTSLRRNVTSAQLLAAVVLVLMLNQVSKATVLSVTDGLVGRYRAGALVGLNDNDIVTNWPDTALGDGVAQDAAAGGTDPRFFSNVTPTGQAVVRFDGNDELRTTISQGIGPTESFSYWLVMRANTAMSSGSLTDGSGAYILDRDTSVTGNPLVSLKVVGGDKYGYQSRYDNGTGLGGAISTTPISLSDFQIVTLRRNTADFQFELWVNGTLEGTFSDTLSALTPQPINIGRHGTGVVGLIGDIAELLVYRGHLDPEDFNSVGWYLQSEYGISGSFLAPPIIPEPSTLTLVGLAVVVGGMRRARGAAKRGR